MTDKPLSLKFYDFEGDISTMENKTIFYSNKDVKEAVEKLKEEMK